MQVALQPEKNMCPNRAEPVALGTALWNGWGRDLDNSRYQPEPAIRASDVGKLALKWSFGYQGGGEFAQPTVVDGRLFIAGASGRIYSLDAKSGCTYWTFDAPGGQPHRHFDRRTRAVEKGGAAEEAEAHLGASRRDQGAERRGVR
jgi:glucose dehydrogenase